MEFVEKWNDMFGQHYRQIRLGYEYLKNTVRLQFPNLREDAARAEQQRSERDRRTQELLQKKYKRLQEEFAEKKKDTLFTLLEMEECFTILEADQREAGVIDHLDVRSMAHQHQEDEEGEDGEDQYERYGAASLRAMHEAQGDKVLHQETQDNAAVFDSLRELLKLLTNKHIPNTQEWMSILMRVDLQEGKFHDAMLKEVIDIRNQLFSARNQCERLGLKCAILEENPTGEDNMDGIEWEVGGVSNDSFEPCYQPISTSPEEQEAGVMAEGSHKSGDATNNTLFSMRKSTDSLLPDTARQGLLNEAPMLTWGSFLDNWGKESGIPANTRGLLLESHWGQVDPDVLIPADKIAEINMRSTYYQPQSSDIRACSAPLRKGGLCQRKDLHTCPLHGRIIPRDSLGKPIHSDSQLGETSSRVDSVPSDRRVTSTKSMHESTSDADDQLKGADMHALESKGQIVGALLKQAITNVRVKAETNRKMKIVLRNKRRKDREHNEAVLRAAAMGQTSQGLQEILGENVESSDSHERRGKASHNRNGGLTSLLRKKPTVKDRLAKRLLTGRVTDATVAQLTRDEESSYRQSFPNQW
ncbi:hypothetical protein O6H91_11G028400 [Diphasiastrum complanatum]|nr:hypothetical protein O6H91_11G028400 [Diphasiastrum complanatum]